MKTLKIIMIAVFVLLSNLSVHAQIKNKKIATIKVFGNCEMCKKNIEKAGDLDKVASVNWNKDTKIATLTYDATKTNEDQILKRIALAGYDNEKFLAPNDKYSALHECCQYGREGKEEGNKVNKVSEYTADNKNNGGQISKNHLQAVYDNYFSLKEALVKTDAATASIKANEMSASIVAVSIDKLDKDANTVWLQVVKNLTADTKNIAATKNIKNQRELFKSLSTNMYALMKVSKSATPTYYQYCPMVKANWLSQDETVKNPYYGATMLTCGATVETIK